MKSTKDFRGRTDAVDSEDSIRKAIKLDPIKKSGKERHSLYEELEEEDDPSLIYRKRESVLDYFDDNEEASDGEDPDEDDWEDEEEDGEDSEEQEEEEQ